MTKYTQISRQKIIGIVIIGIVPYSFRHYYSLRGHIAGIDSGSMAKSMGHSIEAHHRNYPYSSEASTTNAFKRARERLKA